jgi:hypothetical protein
MNDFITSQIKNLHLEDYRFLTKHKLQIQSFVNIGQSSMVILGKALLHDNCFCFVEIIDPIYSGIQILYCQYLNGQFIKLIEIYSILHHQNELNKPVVFDPIMHYQVIVDDIFNIIPTEADNQIRRESIDKLTTQLNHLKCLPVDKADTTMCSFIGEEYRESKQRFYEQAILL